MDLSFGFCPVGCCESGYPVVQSPKLKASFNKPARFSLFSLFWSHLNLSTVHQKSPIKCQFRSMLGLILPRGSKINLK